MYWKPTLGLAASGQGELNSKFGSSQTQDRAASIGQVGTPRTLSLGHRGLAFSKLGGFPKQPLPGSIPSPYFQRAFLACLLSGDCDTPEHLAQRREDSQLHINTQMQTYHTYTQLLAGCLWAVGPPCHIPWKLRMKLDLRPIFRLEKTSPADMWSLFPTTCHFLSWLRSALGRVLGWGLAWGHGRCVVSLQTLDTWFLL